MVSIIFIWEISQELSEPYQSAVTKVITCKDAVGAFFIHPRHSSEISRPLRSDQFVVCWIFLFYVFFKKKTLWESTSKNKRLREKGTCNTVLWNHTNFWLNAIDLNVPKAKLHGFSFVSICELCVLNVVASKSQVVFNRSCCHGNHENVTFDLSVKLFHQYIFYLPRFSLWAATFLLLWFGKWHILTNCQNCVQPP